MTVDDTAKAIRDELETIRVRHGGVLKPEDVVEFARNKRTALHDRFTWDDTEAAAAWRLEEARRVIRVVVEKLPSQYENEEPVRMFVSLPGDRCVPGGGYRSLAEVMSSEDLRSAYLAEALGAAKAWRRKYERIKELRPVFRAIDRVEARQMEPAGK